MAKHALKPLGDRIVIEVVEESEQKTKGGLYIPDTAKEKSQRGKVVADAAHEPAHAGTAGQPACPRRGRPDEVARCVDSGDR